MFLVTLVKLIVTLQVISLIASQKKYFLCIGMWLLEECGTDNNAYFCVEVEKQKYLFICFLLFPIDLHL